MTGQPRHKWFVRPPDTLVEGVKAVIAHPRAWFGLGMYPDVHWDVPPDTEAAFSNSIRSIGILLKPEQALAHARGIPAHVAAGVQVEQRMLMSIWIAMRLDASSMPAYSDKEPVHSDEQGATIFSPARSLLEQIHLPRNEEHTVAVVSRIATALALAAYYGGLARSLPPEHPAWRMIPRHPEPGWSSQPAPITEV